MIEIKLGDRYARSILALSKEKGLLEEVRSDFALIESVCQQNPDFVHMLRSPLIHSDKKLKIIEAILGAKVSKFTHEFLAIVIRKGREPWLRDIAVRFLEMYDGEKNYTRGILRSASPLSADQKAQIVSVVEKDLGTTFFLEERIDPSVIGGFELRVGDLLFDGTIASRLERLKHEFEKNPYVKLT